MRGCCTAAVHAIAKMQKPHVGGSPSSAKSVAADQAPRESGQPLYEDPQAYDAHNGVHDWHMLVVVEWHITLHIKAFHLKAQGGELTGLCKV